MTEPLFSTLDGGTAIGSAAVINAQLTVSYSRCRRPRFGRIKRGFAGLE